LANKLPVGEMRHGKARITTATVIVSEHVLFKAINGLFAYWLAQTIESHRARHLAWMKAHLSRIPQ
jgi:hypothetical protein